MPADEKTRSEILRKNIDKGALHESFPLVMHEHVLYSGVGGNTLNTFMRAVRQGRPVPEGTLKDIVTATGRLSLEALRNVDPAFAQAAEHGVPWIVLSSAIRTEEPQGLHIIQAAENIVGSVQCLTSEVQMINRITTYFDDADFIRLVGLAGLKERLVKQAPHLSDHIDGLCCFAMKLGGSGSIHILWLNELHQRFVGGSRKIKGSFFEAVAEHIALEFPRIKRAIIFCQYSCPKEYVRDKYCDWLSPADIKKVAKDKAWQNRAVSRLQNEQAWVSRCLPRQVTTHFTTMQTKMHR
jgi:hypothetical protein